MLLADPLTATVIGLIGIAVLVASVLVILQCGECWRQNEYEQLSDDKTERLKNATSIHQIKQVQADKNQQEKNITEVLYYTRSLPGSQLMTDHKLWGMGWRVEKTNFLASYQEHVNIISLVKKGKDCALPWNRSGKEVFVKVLTSIKHPLFQLITKPDILFDENLGIVLSFFSPEGSLRDKIFQCEPTNTWDKKYGQGGASLGSRDTAKYGRQILDALRFLHASRIPYTHLHSGNVIIRSGTARLTQLENGLLNVERQNEELFRQFYKLNPKKIETSLELDVLSFGIVLFEMAAGKQMKSLAQLDDVKNIPAEIMKVINLIFRHPEKKIPTVQDLINDPFFSGAASIQNLPEPIVFDKKTLGILTLVEIALRDLVGVFKGPVRAASNLTPRGRTRATQQATEEAYRGWEPGPNATPRPLSTTVSTPSSQTASPAPAPAAAPKAPATPQPAPKTTSVPTSPSVPRATTPAAQPSPAAAPKPAGNVPPPPAPKPGGNVPPPPGPAPVTPKVDKSLSQPNALLMSIEGFKKGGLKKTVTNDRSAPVF